MLRRLVILSLLIAALLVAAGTFLANPVAFPLVLIRALAIVAAFILMVDAIVAHPAVAFASPGNIGR